MRYVSLATYHSSTKSIFITFFLIKYLDEVATAIDKN